MQRVITTALLSLVALIGLTAIRPVLAQSIQTGFAPVHNGRLYYEMSGSGDAVVFVHGNLGDRRHWDLQFEAFAKRFKAVRYDVRGFGRSSLPNETEAYSHYEDLEALLDDLGVKSAHLVGWSMGSGIVVDFAIALPERTRSLITVGPWAFGYSSTATQEIFNGVRQVQAALAAGGHAAAVGAWMSSPFFHNTIVDPAAGERFRAIADDYTFWHFSHADPQRTLQPNAAGRIADIRVPTLIIAGERDLAACLELADILAKSVTGSRKVVMAGVGHMVQMEKSEEFNEIVSAFVSAAAETRGPDDVVDVFARAWNAHDMKAFGPVLSDDADWVTPAGARLKGRAEIQAFLDKEHSGWARTTSTRTTDVAVRVLGADAAVVHSNWEITGASGRDGQPSAPFRGVNVFVVAKQAAGWRVVAGQVAIERRMP